MGAVSVWPRIFLCVECCCESAFNAVTRTCVFVLSARLRKRVLQPTAWCFVARGKTWCPVFSDAAFTPVLANSLVYGKGVFSHGDCSRHMLLLTHAKE